MITLSEAFRLCQIDEEHVWLRVFGEPERKDHFFWVTDVCNRFDTKKIKVIYILPKIDTSPAYEGMFLGMCFVVTGISEDELIKEEIW